MACHYAQYEYTKPIVGRMYARSLRYAQYMFQFRLVRFNGATEIARLRGAGGYDAFVSLSELSRWHLLPG